MKRNVCPLVYLLNIFLIGSFVPMHALIVGSNTALSREGFVEFPAGDTDNTILGFAWLDTGFKLEDQTTSCTFNAIFPVSGSVNLNGGTLYLLQDLRLTNILSLEGLGTIIGNGHSIDFCESITYMPSNLTAVKDLTVFIHSDVDLVGTVTFQGNCLIVGNGNIFDFQEDSRIIVDAGSTLELQNITLEDVGNKVFCADNTSHLVLDNVVCCIMDDWTFSYGDILFQNKVDLVGHATFTYDGVMTCSVDDETVVRLDGGLVFKIGSRDLVNHIPLFFYDEESIITCGECSFIVTGSGLNLRRGRIEFESNAVLESPLTSSSQGLILGDGISSEEDMTMVLGPGSFTDFRSGWFTFNNADGNKFYASAPSARFLRRMDSNFCVAITCTFPQCTLEFEHIGYTIPATLIVPGATLYYDNTHLLIPGVGEATFRSYRREGTWSCVLENGGSLYFTSGLFPGVVQVVGPDNKLYGSGAVSGAILFTDYTSTLTCGLEGSIQGALSLAGGTFYLSNNVYFTMGASFPTPGTIDLGRYLMDLGHENVEFTVPITWYGNGGCINLNSNISLKSTWTINGNCSIVGHGETLALDAGGVIVIGPHSKLTISGVKLDVIDFGDIRCADDTGLLVLDNVFWLQHSNFVFDKGALNFNNEVIFGGQDYAFEYQSVMTSTILSNTQLVLGKSFTFKYAPGIPSKDLLQFEDFTSSLILNGATLSMTMTGMNLTNGILQIDQDATIEGETGFDFDGNSINEGLTVGDGVAAHDHWVIFMGAKKLTIASGAFNYKNVLRDSLSMSLMSILDMGSGSILRLYETINLGSGAISFEQGSALALAVGRQIEGSVNAVGQFSRIEL